MKTWTYIPSLEVQQGLDLGEQQKSAILLDSQISLVYVDASTSSPAVDDFTEQRILNESLKNFLMDMVHFVKLSAQVYDSI